MKCRIDSGLDAPMVAVDRFVSADLRILEAIGLLLCREKLDVLAKSALVAFECENVVGLLGQDFRRDVALRTPKPCGSPPAHPSWIVATSCRRWRSHRMAYRSAPPPTRRSIAGTAWRRASPECRRGGRGKAFRRETGGTAATARVSSRRTGRCR